MKYLIVGLGNIGEEYARTRHNIGFDIADALAAKHNTTFSSNRLADQCEIKWKGRTMVVIKPTTYMNLSGKAVRYWLDKEKIPVERMLVLVDDLALPLSVLRLRPGGSDAGHNGLKSIHEAIGNTEYPRLRFGIGNDYPRGRQVDFVLSQWAEEEKALIQKKILKSVEIIESFITLGIVRCMNSYNKLSFT